MAKGQNKFDVMIVGTGHGGAQAAISLRQQGFSGSVLMIGRDPELPYERPPLSKEYLAREKTFERIQIRPLQFWSDKGIDLRLGESVVLVDAKAHRVKLAGGAELEYGVLVWATGGDPRLLACSGAELAGLHAVRDRSDVDRIMAELDGGAKRVVIIGGGYIGLEAAAVMTKLGCSVSLVEMQACVLERVAGPELSAFYEAEHRAHGVDLRTSTTVECIEGDGTRATGVRLAGGEILPADLVIVGIGIVPAVELLAEAGAACSNGVEVDEYCRTSLADIYAIGDCAAHANAFAGGAVIRLESVQNANDMAHVAAAAICGAPHPYAATPWFWSNQYDLKLQTVGLNIGHSVRVLRGDPATRSFSVIYLRDGVVVALDCVNAMKDFVQGRKLVEARSTPDPAKLADPDTPLKQLL